MLDTGLNPHFVAELKAINPDVKVAYHSDGNILPIIPEFIEIGIDVLNPIQPASMNPAQLKQQFGDMVPPKVAAISENPRTR